MPTTLTDARDGRVLAWLPKHEIDDEVRAQALRTAGVACVRGHVALMPDAHLGKGATIGSVIPTADAIIPSAVGVDIGCGVVAAPVRELTLERLPEDLDPLVERWTRAIPAGLGQWTGDIDRAWAAFEKEHGHPTLWDDDPKVAERAPRQLGTLGSGNHFLELCADDADQVWLMLHSGSRGPGNRLATHHIERAKSVMRRLALDVPDPELAYLVQGEPEFDAYIHDLLWAQAYARFNRDRMMRLALAELAALADRQLQFDVSRYVNNCLAGSTPVLTADGVVPIRDLAGGTYELLTSNGRWVKAPIKSYGNAPLIKVTLSRSGVTKVIHATPEHRWILRGHNSHHWAGHREATTAQLRPLDRLAFSFPIAPEQRTVDRMAVARGFVYGDGNSTDKNRSCANFCGTKDEALLPFFDGIGNPLRTYRNVKRITGLPGEWKRTRPSLDAPPSLLYGWLAGYFAADGDVDKTGRPTLTSAYRDNLDYVRTLCTRIGIGTFGVRRAEQSKGGFSPEGSLRYLVGLMRGDLSSDFFLIAQHRERFEAGQHAAERRGWTVVAVEATDRVEEVFCATVDGTHTFTLEDNILTGNSHNYAALEEHGGRKLWITRKGAISARTGQLGVIPGSMGTGSYIVRGRGNPASYHSASHGAGRRMSRTKARKTFTLEEMERAMQGRVWQRAAAKRLIDEIPGAYKDLDAVIAYQHDLVEVVTHLRTLVNYKGT